MGVMAATPAFPVGADICARRYRQRNPRATPLYQLLETHYDTVKGTWEERFERRYGFWRGYYDTAVARYYDCGLFESGFAGVKCTECPNEFLVAFSCKGRGPCPSCGVKRAALFSELLQQKILADVPHADTDLWIFPSMESPHPLHYNLEVEQGHERDRDEADDEEISSESVTFHSRGRELRPDRNHPGRAMRSVESARGMRAGLEAWTCDILGRNYRLAPPLLRNAAFPVRAPPARGKREPSWVAQRRNESMSRYRGHPPTRVMACGAPKEVPHRIRDRPYVFGAAHRVY